MRKSGVTSRGIIMPIFKEGDNLVQIVSDNIIEASKEEGFSLNDGDIVGLTESVLGRVQGNYATCQQIAGDIKSKILTDTLGVVFPILSRNRFAILLKAISMSAKNIVVQLSYPSDEVGNKLFDPKLLKGKYINPYTDCLTEDQFRELFGYNTKHPFTGIDYVEYYKSINNNISIIFSNDPTSILNYASDVLVCDIHTRFDTKETIESKDPFANVLCLDNILTSSFDGSGYNEKYGLYGSNRATEDKVKLFPRDCNTFVNSLQEELLKKTGKHMEVLVYGDGAFKDPVGGIWELADPVVSPGFTKGLIGTPNEIKLKYFADNDLANLSGNELIEAMKEKIREKDSNLVATNASLGTTPRQITDLVGSLCDLTSGSGDRGTPVVLIQGYFTNFAS